jgi:hypothetical protein
MIEPEILDDELMDVIRRARPDDRAAARDAGPQALVDEILALPRPATGPAAPVGSAPVRRLRPAHRNWFVGAAAVAAALAASFLVVVQADEPSAATVVDTALARSTALADRSGRAHVVARYEYDDGLVETMDDNWEFSGEDSSVTFDPSERTDRDEWPINRRVDGELYLYLPGHGPKAGTMEWYRTTGADAASGGRLDLVPATLLSELDPAGGFDEVGHGEVRGVDTTHLRAADPEGTPVPDLDDVYGRTVKSLDVWVDGDGLVRRLELVTVGEAQRRPGDADLVEMRMSVELFDLGEPVTIEVPTQFSDEVISY